MLVKEEFERQIYSFMHSFEEKYTEDRLDLMYGELHWLTPKELQQVLIEMLKRYNWGNLPSIHDIKLFAYKIAPEVIYFDHYDGNLRVV